MSQLAPQERARCEARLVLAARTASRVDAIPAEKRAYYDKVVAAYAKMSAPAPQIITHPATTSAWRSAGRARAAPTCRASGAA